MARFASQIIMKSFLSVLAIAACGAPDPAATTEETPVELSETPTPVLPALQEAPPPALSQQRLLCSGEAVVLQALARPSAPDPGCPAGTVPDVSYCFGRCLTGTPRNGICEAVERSGPAITWEYGQDNACVYHRVCRTCKLGEG